jgi:hypothetical protein
LFGKHPHSINRMLLAGGYPRKDYVINMVLGRQQSFRVQAPVLEKMLAPAAGKKLVWQRSKRERVDADGAEPVDDEAADGAEPVDDEAVATASLRRNSKIKLRCLQVRFQPMDLKDLL